MFQAVVTRFHSPSYPSKIVPFGPDGELDMMARQIASEFSTYEASVFYCLLKVAVLRPWEFE